LGKTCKDLYLALSGPAVSLSTKSSQFGRGLMYSVCLGSFNSRQVQIKSTTEVSYQAKAHPKKPSHLQIRSSKAEKPKIEKKTLVLTPPTSHAVNLTTLMPRPLSLPFPNSDPKPTALEAPAHRENNKRHPPSHDSAPCLRSPTQRRKDQRFARAQHATRNASRAAQLAGK